MDRYRKLNFKIPVESADYHIASEFVIKSIEEIVENTDISVLDMSFAENKKPAHMGFDDIEYLCNKYNFNYEFKVTMLKIAIFKREGTKGIIESIKGSNEDKETEDEGSKSQKKGKKEKEEEEEDQEDKGLKEKIDDIKPILKELKKFKKIIRILIFI